MWDSDSAESGCTFWLGGADFMQLSAIGTKWRWGAAHDPEFPYLSCLTRRHRQRLGVVSESSIYGSHDAEDSESCQRQVGLLRIPQYRRALSYPLQRTYTHETHKSRRHLPRGRIL